MLNFIKRTIQTKNQDKPLLKSNNKAIMTEETITNPPKKQENLGYDNDFIESARQLLDFDMTTEYLDLIMLGYKPPVQQQRDWDIIVETEIRYNKTGLLEKLLDNNYPFNNTQVWGLFCILDKNIEFKEKIIQKFNAEYEYFLPNLFDMCDRKICYFRPKGNIEEIAQWSPELKIYATHLKNLWILAQKNKENLNSYFNIIKNIEDKLKNYSRHFYPNNSDDQELQAVWQYIDSIIELKKQCVEELKKYENNPNKIEDMKNYLRGQHIEKVLSHKTKELQIKKINAPSATPPHIQVVLDNIFSIYKTVINTQKIEIQFEIKNLIEKNVPELLAAYLAFPIQYRNTFKNDCNETPETLLLKGLSNQLEILKSFEKSFLAEKSKNIEVLTLYSHNKKMSLAG